ncbi:MAG: glutamyl-tRNA amidotransferase [Alphaproteobacteria bacterium]|nr:glutamyl-tRNA amidotransferase [Alphaproteobacteria bacterium]
MGIFKLFKSLLAFLIFFSGFSQSNADDFKFVEATIDDIHQALSSGDMTCREIVSGYLNRIKSYDQQSGLNAITVVNQKALDKADQIDRKISNGEKLGPLYCVPMLIKDNYDTHDLPTTGGSIALMNNYPPDDAFMVRKLRESDAIVIAKTNMAEWAFSPRQTKSSSFGTTANAYDLSRVPAGSSGGTASGTAASFGVAGMGTDTGNSIRGPSSHLALFGIRSTIGLTSRDGIIPLAWDRDVAGPMTRTVKDGALIFNVVAGYDPNDPMTELGKGKRKADYTAFLKKDGLKGKRIGVLRALVTTEDADPEIIALFLKAVDDLKAAGAIIVDPFEITNLDQHREAPNFCRRFRYDMHEYLKSLGDKAPIKDVMEVLETGEYSPYVKGGLENFGAGPLDIHPGNENPPCPEYPNHPGRNAFKADVIKSMDKYNVDVVIYPSWTNPPAKLDLADEDYKGDNSQIIAPATGLPAATVPMGYSHGNLPAGLQILARPFREDVIFGVAYAYEQATKHRKPPSLFPELKNNDKKM